MTQFSDALQNLTGQLISQRTQSLGRQIANEQVRVANDFASSVFSDTEKDYKESDPGTFDANDALTKFDERADDLLNQIENPDQRSKMSANFSRTRSAYELDVNRKAIASTQQLEKKRIQEDLNAFGRDILDPSRNPDDILAFYQNANELRKEAYTGDSQVIIDKASQQAYSLYFDSRMNKALSDYSSGALDDKGLEKSLTGLRSLLVRDDRFKDISAKSRGELAATIDSKKNALMKQAKVRRANQLSAEFDGYVMSREAGKGKDFVYEQAVLNTFTGPKREKARLTFEAADRSEGFYDAKSVADLEDMVAIRNSVAGKLEKAKGQEFEITSVQLQSLDKQIKKTLKLIEKNPYDFYKNDPVLKTAAVRAASSGDYADYIQTAYSVQVANGVLPDMVTYLDSSQLKSIRGQLSGLRGNPDQLEQVLLNLREAYGATVDRGTRAIDSVLTQLVENTEENEMPGDLKFVIHHAGEPYFNDLVNAMNTSESELKKNIDSFVIRDTRDEVRSAINDFMGTQNPAALDSETINEAFDVTRKLALRYVLTGVASDGGDAAKKAYKTLFDNHYHSDITGMNGTRVFPRRAIDGEPIDVNSIKDFVGTTANMEHLLDAKVNKILGSDAEVRSDAFDFSDVLSGDLSTSVRDEITFSSLKKFSRWIPSPDDRGLDLYYETSLGDLQPVKFVDGSIMRVPYKDINDGLFQKTPAFGSFFLDPEDEVAL